MTWVLSVLQVLGILIFVPIIGGLLTGVDRIISARMQSRKGPPLLQPFYDVFKLLKKEATTVNHATGYFVTGSVLFNILTVVLFCMGVDLLLCIFAFTLGCVLFVLAGYSSHSPYSFVGSERELIQIMCYEPMILIMAFGYYRVVESFNVGDAFTQNAPAIVKLPLIFLGLVYVLTIKLRKSPFDLSMSHHGHQEIVKGITTELTGTSLALLEISHWFETVFALGLVYLFFVYSAPFSWAVAAAICLVVFFLEIIIDNGFARVKWKFALTSSWIVIIVTGGANLMYLSLF
ncbi:MAG: NADH-quinone oxidoreductase subunit H [Propionibacteriaceae bacterium]|nr:NADH-quinone oxidoreductase subunit H [Propionibacteriaceae bacterium]